MKCFFCGIDAREGTGVLYVTKTGKKHFFCSSKCEKNQLKLKRKAGKQKWTFEHQEIKKGIKKR